MNGPARLAAGAESVKFAAAPSIHCALRHNAAGGVVGAQEENVQFASGRFAFWTVVNCIARFARAAILGEIFDQAIHRAELGAVDDQPALSARSYEAACA